MVESWVNRNVQWQGPAKEVVRMCKPQRKLGGLPGHVQGMTPGCGCVVRQMQNPRGPPSLVSAQMAAGQLSESGRVPSAALGRSRPWLRPPELKPHDFEPGRCRGGWQHEGSIQVERQHRASVMVWFTDSECAMLRSQSGPLAGVRLQTL